MRDFEVRLQCCLLGFETKAEFRSLQTEGMEASLKIGGEIAQASQGYVKACQLLWGIVKAHGACKPGDKDSAFAFLKAAGKFHTMMENKIYERLFGPDFQVMYSKFKKRYDINAAADKQYKAQLSNFQDPGAYI